MHALSLRLTVVAGLLAFIGLVALQHPLRGDLPPGQHFISEYAKGSTAGVQVLAFACWAIALGAATALAARAPAPGRAIARRITVAGLGLAAVGIAAAAAFATQTIAGVMPSGVQRTTEGRLHDVATLAAFAGLLAAAAASLRLVARRGYRLALGALTAVLLLTVPVLVALGIDAPGVGQRIFILSGCAFVWRLAVELSGASGTPRAHTRRRARSAAPSVDASTAGR